MKLSQSSQFKKDIKNQIKRGKNPHKLMALVDLLLVGESLPDKCRDHPLIGSGKVVETAMWSLIGY